MDRLIDILSTKEVKVPRSSFPSPSASRASRYHMDRESPHNEVLSDAHNPMGSSETPVNQDVLSEPHLPGVYELPGSVFA